MISTALLSKFYIYLERWGSAPTSCVGSIEKFWESGIIYFKKALYSLDLFSLEFLSILRRFSSEFYALVHILPKNCALLLYYSSSSTGVKSIDLYLFSAIFLGFSLNLSYTSFLLLYFSSIETFCSIFRNLPCKPSLSMFWEMFRV